MRLARLITVAGAGGALGAAVRAWVTQLAATDAASTAALAATLLINVVGCAALAALPAAEFVRRSSSWSVFLGTGVLGGFTTMSAAVAIPLAALSPARATGYLALTLAAALLAVWVVRLPGPDPDGTAGLRPEGTE